MMRREGGVKNWLNLFGCLSALGYTGSSGNLAWRLGIAALLPKKYNIYHSLPWGNVLSGLSDEKEL